MEAAMRPPEEAPHRVPIIVHFEKLREADHDLAEERDKRYAAERRADALAVDAALAAAKEAVAVAKAASDDHLKAHNDVLEGWKRDRATFVTREVLDERRALIDTRREEDRSQEEARFGRLEAFQSKLLGGMGVLALIGIANLAKLWLT